MNVTSYAITDNSTAALTTTVYYRIKENGLRGETHYSPIVKLKVDGEKNGLSVYPNPIKEGFVLSGYAHTSGLQEMKIFDLSGKLVQSEKWMQNRGSYSRNIIFDKAPAGVYWIQVSNKEKTLQAKIIKQ